MSDKPFAYIRGFSEFYKLRFKVSEDVLIPRPETELLVDFVLSLNPSTVLDLGTGSGNIAISLAINNPKIKITASDISEKALKIAKQNARFHQVLDRINFIQADLLEPSNTSLRGVTADRDPGAAPARSEATEDGGPTPKEGRDSLLTGPRAKHIYPPEVLAANLPYIPSSRIPKLDSSVKDFEPILALDGGKDGFELYRKLFIQMVQKNFFPKILLLEIDDTHALLGIKEVRKYFPKALVDVKRDLTKRVRFLYIQLWS